MRAERGRNMVWFRRDPDKGTRFHRILWRLSAIHTVAGATASVVGTLETKIDQLRSEISELRAAIEVRQ